ncbi:MAG: hypothetical protein NTX00_03365 [Candidatus Parcubacteria bacterium]|nr:hypothetical protein [Candidatus Parcubacteria bacterium]
MEHLLPKYLSRVPKGVPCLQLAMVSLIAKWRAIGEAEPRLKREEI